MTDKRREQMKEKRLKAHTWPYTADERLAFYDGWKAADATPSDEDLELAKTLVSAYENRNEPDKLYAIITRLGPVTKARKLLEQGEKKDEAIGVLNTRIWHRNQEIESVKHKMNLAIIEKHKLILDNKGLREDVYNLKCMVNTLNKRLVNLGENNVVWLSTAQPKDPANTEEVHEKYIQVLEGIENPKLLEGGE